MLINSQIMSDKNCLKGEMVWKDIYVCGNVSKYVVMAIIKDFLDLQLETISQQPLYTYLFFTSILERYITR